MLGTLPPAALVDSLEELGKRLAATTGEWVKAQPAVTGSQLTFGIQAFFIANLLVLREQLPELSDAEFSRSVIGGFESALRRQLQRKQWEPR